MTGPVVPTAAGCGARVARVDARHQFTPRDPRVGADLVRPAAGA